MNYPEEPDMEMVNVAEVTEGNRQVLFYEGSGRWKVLPAKQERGGRMLSPGPSPSQTGAR